MKIRITVQSITPIKHGKFRVKIKESAENITDMEHEGRRYKTVKRLSRGRYIVRLCSV